MKYHATASGYICHLDLGYRPKPFLITGLIELLPWVINFLLSRAAFTIVNSVGVYTRKIFTQVSILQNLGKMHSISQIEALSYSGSAGWSDCIN